MPDESLPLPSAPDTSLPPSTDDSDSGSLSDHEQAYHKSGQDETRQAQTEPSTPPAETAPPEPDTTDADPRDDKGRFLPKKRHRAASQEASPEDVPRIRELSTRLRAAEAERDALKARMDGGGPSRPAASVAPPPPPAPAAPKPDINDYLKGEDDYSVGFAKWVDALDDWKDAQRETKRQETARQDALAAEQHRLTTSWTQRVTAAKAKYPDFEAVALPPVSVIPQGSLIDAWILEHKTGADLLYYFEQHHDEVSNLLALPLIEQATELALLSQRFNGSSSRTAAVGTGSAPAVPPPPAPRPPNPVRTGPMSRGDEPPGDDASLADHEKYFAPRRRRG